jgi:hypothetical protein
MDFVLFLHITGAIFLIGPLTIAAATSPRFIRTGNVEVTRFLHRTTRLYGLLSILVFVLGLALVNGEYTFSEQWITASMTLFLVALGLLFGLVERDQRTALARLESGEGAPVPAGRIVGVSSAIGVLWLVILLLMVFRPGH